MFNKIKTFTLVLAITAWQKAYAALIPCSDGSYADPAIGCVATPGNVVNTQSDVTEWVFKIASSLSALVAIAATAGLIWSGIQYAMAAGDEIKIQQAKRNMFWSIFGLIVSGLAFLIVRSLTGFLG